MASSETQAMIVDAMTAADLLQRLDRRIGDLQLTSSALVRATQRSSSALIHEAMTDSYHTIVSISSILVPLRRTVMSYDGLGSVLSITELALRVTRFVALTLLPVASQLVRDFVTELDKRTRLERRLFVLQQETHRIGLIWVPHRARLRSGAARLGGNWDGYVASTQSAWRCWMSLRGDAELDQALRNGLSRSMPSDLHASCAALLTILHVQRFGGLDAGTSPTLTGTTMSSWLNDAAKPCE